MLSYRHGFHAGNFADVHKHVTLVLLLESLLKKETPFCYIDTHAGAAMYNLQSGFAQKHREFENGIGRLWHRGQVPPPVMSYLQLVAAMKNNRGARESPRYYPGSPALAKILARPQDRMILMELHPADFRLLKSYFARDRRARVECRDGFEGLMAVLPPAERRGLVLVDPAYEAGNELERLAGVLERAWRKWPTGVYAVWYPLQKGLPVRRFHRELRNAGAKKIFLCEINVVPDSGSNRLGGSGMIIINPPWQVDLKLEEALAWLVPLLDRGTGLPPRCEWLVGEGR